MSEVGKRGRVKGYGLQLKADGQFQSKEHDQHIKTHI
jgi:hypothetical protein